MKVAIIGAGMSGLCSVKWCLEEKLEPVCFEKKDHIGGIWKYEPEYKEGDGAMIYEQLRVNGSREHTMFSDFPDEENYTEVWPSHRSFYLYLCRYAKHFNLEKFIKLEHSVLNVTELDDGTWKVIYENQNGRFTEHFDKIMVCTGRFVKPILPDIEGRETFTGKFLHANHYRHNQTEDIVDKNVLVIGNSFTAAEIAPLVTSTAKNVWLSIGRGGSLVSRKVISQTGYVSIETGFIIRAHVYARNALDILCRWFEVARRQVLPNYEDYHLVSENPILLFRPALVCQALADKLIEGAVEIKKTVTKIDGDSVNFADGSTIKPDTIFAATGYDISFPFLSKDIVADSVSKADIYEYVWPVTTKKNNLAFIGSTIYAFGPYVPLVELQARWATSVFSGHAKLPPRDEMRKTIETRHENVMKLFGKDVGQTDVPILVYFDFLADQIGALPSWWRFILTDPYLAHMIWYANAYPISYRLVGRHKLPYARRELAKMYEKWRKNMGDTWTFSKSSALIGAVAVIGLGLGINYAVKSSLKDVFVDFTAKLLKR